MAVESSMLIEFQGYRPQVAATAFIAPTAVLIGNVVIHDGASVWFGAVLRGDNGENAIVIGARSNVQDNVVIHVAPDRGTVVGEDVTVGHGAILEGCIVEDRAVVGMNAVLLEGSLLGRGSMLAAGSTLTANTTIPPASLAAGAPAMVRKPISGNSARWIDNAARHYVELAQKYREALGGEQ